MSKQVSLNAGGTRVTKDYAGSSTPAFDAVEDIKEYFGVAKWREVSAAMRSISSRRQFAFYASLAGIEGFPVQAWYDLYWGEGSFIMSEAQLAAQTTYNQNLARVYFAAATRAQSSIKRNRWMWMSAHFSACARRHLFNLLESQNDE